MMSNDELIARIKNVPIDAVVESTGLHILNRGSKVTTVEHDSLILDLRLNRWWWYSKNEHGDNIAWVMTRKNLDFRPACEYIARIGGFDCIWAGSSIDFAERVAAVRRDDALKIAVEYWHNLLLKTPDALAYAHGRGWNMDTIAANKLGYTGTDGGAGLAAELARWGYVDSTPLLVALCGMRGSADQVRQWCTAYAVPLNEQWVKSGGIWGMWGNALTYPYFFNGRVNYFAARDISQKRHFYPPNWAGMKRRCYYNNIYNRRALSILLVEGQADAITMGALGIAAIAMGGLTPGDSDWPELVQTMQSHKYQFVAVDADKAGKKHALNLALGISPLTAIVDWGDAKDANDWLKISLGGDLADAARNGMGYRMAIANARDRISDILGTAKPAIVVLGAAIANADRGERLELLKQLALHWESLTPTQRNAVGGDICDAIGQTLDGKKMTVARLKKALGEILGEIQADEIKNRIEIFSIGGRCRTGLPDGWLFEPIYNAEKRVAHWAVKSPDGKIFETGATHVIDNIVVGLDQCIRDYAEQQVLSLPSAIGRVRTIDDLLESIYRLLYEYIDSDDTFLRLTSMGIFFTWFYDWFPVVPYFRMMGDAGTGKTRWLEAAAALTYRGLYMTGATSEPPLFRAMHSVRGTLILDEGDFDKSNIGDHISKMLTVGYRENGRVIRSGSENKKFAAEFFDVFCPKFISSRRDFGDNAVGDRAFSIQSRLATRETPRMILGDFRSRAETLRNDLLAFRMQYWEQNSGFNYNQLADYGITARLDEISIPMKYLFSRFNSVIGPELLRQFIAEQQTVRQADLQDSMAGKVLEAILRIVDSETPDKKMGRDEYPSLTVGVLARMVDRMFELENQRAENHGLKIATRKEFSARAAGIILRERLGMKPERRNDANRSYAVYPDGVRLAVLRRQYGFGSFDNMDDIRQTNELKKRNEQMAL